MQTLCLFGNNITTLPPELFTIGSLVELDLSYNALTELPSGISQLRQLAKLSLSGNALTSIPEQLAEVQTLQVLFVCFSCLFPLFPSKKQNQEKKKKKLTLDKVLKVSKNWLSEESFSESFRWDQMTSLTRLDLSRNRFEILPHLYRSPWIKRLKIRGNPLRAMPLELVEQGNVPDIIDYLRSLFEDSKVQWPRIRGFVLGLDGVGKTALLSCLRCRTRDATTPSV